MPAVQDLINQRNGTVFGITGPDQGQCTAVAHAWELMCGLPIVYGNAIDTFDNAPDVLYAKELNTPEGVPAPGAIMVWNMPWGKYFDEGQLHYAGHTAVVVSANVNTFDCLEQNDGNNGVTYIGRHNYADVIGWFTPRMLQSLPPAQSTPVEAPVSIPSPLPVQSPPPAEAPLPEPPVPVVPVPAPSDHPDASPAPGTAGPLTPSPSDGQPGSHQTTDQPSPSGAGLDILHSSTQGSITPSIKQPIIGTDMSKYLSRKFILTILTSVGLVAAYISGALDAGIAMTSVTFLVGLYTVVQGAIDKVTASQ